MIWDIYSILVYLGLGMILAFVFFVLLHRQMQKDDRGED